MNEKLKEIAVKAQVEHCVSHVRLQEFAELIVRECAEQCTTDGPYVAEVVWGKQFHKKILEHFGVEL